MLTNRNPISCEIHAEALTIQGNFPPGLCGTLYRNGPNPEMGAEPAHWFLGAGMVHAISIGGGRCAYRNRLVMPKAPGAGKANTHVVPHAGRLLALEEAHAPVGLVPETLVMTDAPFPQVPFTAHPKHDPVTGKLVFFGYAVEGRGSRIIRCGALDAAGNKHWEMHFEAPFCSMIHDMGLTPSYVVLPVLPLIGAARDDAAFGVSWRPDAGAWLAGLPRGGSARDVRWHEAPTAYAFHIAHTWEEGGRLFLDLFVYDAPPLFPDASRAITPRNAARLERWSIPLKGPGSVRAGTLHDLPGEFPRIDDRFAGGLHGATYCTLRTNTERSDFQAIARLDTEGRHADHFCIGSQASVSEPVFVPRSPDAPADDGWLLALAWRPDWATSRLTVFDARHIGDGPIASVRLPQRVPDGFHGSFLPNILLSQDMLR